MIVLLLKVMMDLELLTGPFIFFLSMYKMEGGKKWVRTG